MRFAWLNQRLRTYYEVCMTLSAAAYILWGLHDSISGCVHIMRFAWLNQRLRTYYEVCMTQSAAAYILWGLHDSTLPPPLPPPPPPLLLPFPSSCRRCLPPRMLCLWLCSRWSWVRKCWMSTWTRECWTAELPWPRSSTSLPPSQMWPRCVGMVNSFHIEGLYIGCWPIPRFCRFLVFICVCVCVYVGPSLHRLFKVWGGCGGPEVRPGKVHRELHQLEGGRGRLPGEGCHCEEVWSSCRRHGIWWRGAGEKQ